MCFTLFPLLLVFISYIIIINVGWSLIWGFCLWSLLHLFLLFWWFTSLRFSFSWIRSWPRFRTILSSWIPSPHIIPPWLIIGLSNLFLQFLLLTLTGCLPRWGLLLIRSPRFINKSIYFHTLFLLFMFFYSVIDLFIIL